MDDSQANHSKIPFRIRIGVVCDGSLPERAKLAEKLGASLEGSVFDLFDENSKRRVRAARHTPLAFSVLSSLTEAAERLLAHEILRLPNSTLELILPSEEEKHSEAAKASAAPPEFEELRQRARRQRFVKGPGPASAGRYIVDHCDLLITFCDEKAATSGHAALAETLAYARTKQRPIIKISPIAPYDVSTERGHGLNARSISGIDRFNDFFISEEEQERDVSKLYHELFHEQEGLPEEAKQEARLRLMPFYVRASNLAKSNQTHYRRAGFFVYLFSALSVAAVAVGTLFHDLSPLAFSIELLLLLSILALVFYANRRRSHKKWIESRYLAERLRSAIFLAVCGMEASPVLVPPYMGDPNQPDAWMTMTFNEIWGRLPERRGCAHGDCANFERFVRERWIKDQILFHEGKERKSERKNHLLEVGGLAVFGLAVIAAALHLILFFSTAEGEHEGEGARLLEKILTFAAIFLPALGAALGGIRAHREYSRLAKRSRNMAVSLKRMEERFLHVQHPETLSALLQEAERLMLMETQDWLMLMSFAKLEAAA